MKNVDYRIKALKKKLLSGNNLIFTIIFLAALVLRLIYYFKVPELWWDEAIYIGMGKHIFSGGVLGIWESFRPLVMPLLLGFGWFIGIPVFFWGNFLQVFFTMGIIVMVYLIGERFQKNAGLIASFLVAFMPLFLSFGDKNLSAIPATFFFLVAIYYVIKEKWYLSGIFMSLAFLTRFVMGLITVAIGVSVVAAFIANKKWDKKSIKILVNKSIRMLLGFFTLTLPYFIANKIMYNDFLFPLKEGSDIFVKYNNWIYNYGNILYLKQLFIQNLFLCLFVAGIILFVCLKKYKQEGFNSVVLMSILVSAYFLSVTHKEVRFVIPVFILFAILSGFAIAYGLERLKNLLSKSKNAWCERAYYGVVALLVIVMLFSVYLSFESDEPYFLFDKNFSGPQKDFYTYFSDEDINSKAFMTSSPFFSVFTNKQSILMISWFQAPRIYEENFDKIDAVAIDLCEHPCEPGTECEQLRTEFLDMLNAKHEVEFNTTYKRWDAKNCELTIWSTK